MAGDFSFDVVSKVNMQEVDNAINQTIKEIGQRFDFKGSHTEINLESQDIKIMAADEFKLKNVVDILQTKLIKRGVPIRNLDYGKAIDASGGAKRQIVTVKQGIETEKAKQIVKDIKALNLKIQSQIMSDQIRVSGKNKDDLQKVIHFLKEKDYNLDLQFMNYR